MQTVFARRLLTVVIWQEHLIGLSDEELEDGPKPVVVKDQTTISRLEEQAEEFLNAILCRKGQIACLCGNDRLKCII